MTRNSVWVIETVNTTPFLLLPEALDVNRDFS